MNINDFLGIAIVGAALSILIQWLKDRLGYNSWAIKGITVLLSIIVGGLYFLLRDTTWWATIIGVLAAASTVYALFLRAPDSKKETTP